MNQSVCHRRGMRKQSDALISQRLAKLRTFEKPIDAKVHEGLGFGGGATNHGFELQCEAFRVMKVGLTRRMSQRPVGKRSVESFDHARNSDTQLDFALESGKAIYLYGSAKLENVFAALGNDFRFEPIARISRTIAISSKRVGCPFSRRRKIEFVILGIVFRADKRFKTSPPP